MSGGYSGSIVRREELVDISLDDACLASAQISNYQYLIQVLLLSLTSLQRNHRLATAHITSTSLEALGDKEQAG